MRRVPGRVRLAGLIGASGVGTYLGAAVAVLVAVLSRQVFTEGSSWPAAVVVLAVLGAGAGALGAGLTGVARRLRRRALVLSAGGSVSLPLATAIGHLQQVYSVGIGLVLFGGVVARSFTSSAVVGCPDGFSAGPPVPRGDPCGRCVR